MPSTTLRARGVTIRSQSARRFVLVSIYQDAGSYTILRRSDSLAVLVQYRSRRGWYPGEVLLIFDQTTGEEV